MQTKETQDQYKKEITSLFSLFSLDDNLNIHPRRVKSDPIPVSNFSFDYFHDNNKLNEPSPDIKHIPDVNPDIKSNENSNNTNVLLSNNSYGFKGRSPYVSSSNNNINNTFKKTFNNNIINNEHKIISKQKIINGFIFTELKDKVFEYRCSVCNFIAHDNGELHKHLAINKHFILPKKYKKNNKPKPYHKTDNNRLNQTFMFSMNKPKKYFDKKIICKHCSKRFESNYSLNSHLNAHKYKCDICFKLFNNKEDLLEHNHDLEVRDKEMDSPIKKKRNKFYKEKNKIEIDDWEEVQSNKKEKRKESKKSELGESYVFIEENDENIDFNRMVKINDEI